MKNHQAPWALAKTHGLTLSVHSIFRTVQGEGPFAGCPAIFVRLAGCNLQCPLCDTEYTEGAEETTPFAILEQVGKLDPLPRRVDAFRLVVITGGEPFRQNIATLCTWLSDAGYHVQIETNGALPIQDKARYDLMMAVGALTVVVSPKGATVHSDIEKVANCYKYVITAGDVNSDGLPNRALDNPLPKRQPYVARPPKGYSGTVYVQPADSYDTAQNAANMQAAIASVQKGAVMQQDRRLCLQMHKYANLP